MVKRYVVLLYFRKMTNRENTREEEMNDSKGFNSIFYLKF